MKRLYCTEDRVEEEAPLCDKILVLNGFDTKIPELYGVKRRGNFLEEAFWIHLPEIRTVSGGFSLVGTIP